MKLKKPVLAHCLHGEIQTPAKEKEDVLWRGWNKKDYWNRKGLLVYLFGSAGILFWSGQMESKDLNDSRIVSSRQPHYGIKIHN
jgi:hypothetical protein